MAQLVPVLLIPENGETLLLVQCDAREECVNGCFELLVSNCPGDHLQYETITCSKSCSCKRIIGRGIWREAAEVRAIQICYWLPETSIAT